MTAGQQEVSFRDLVRSASDADLRRLVLPAALDLLETLRPEVLAGPELRRLVTGSCSVRDYLLDSEQRPRVLDLLTINQAKLLVSRLGHPLVGSPHEQLHRASMHPSAAELDVILALFGAEADTRSGGTTFSAARKETPAGYPLFSHQRDAMRRVQKGLYGGSRRVVLHMPTGAGKTRTAMNIIAEHLRSNEPTVVAWLAYSEELLEQAAAEFEAAWSCLGSRNVDVIRFWGDRNVDLSSVSDGLVVAGLGKIYAAGRKDLNLIPTLGDSTTLVVMDEAHQSIAETYSFVLDILASKRPDTALLGLTATPGRTYNDIEQDELLSRFWAGAKVMLEIPGFDNPVKYLIEEGYLARPTFRTVHSHPGLTPSDADLTRIKASLDLPDEILKRLGDSQLWNTALITETQELLSRHRRIIVFATTVHQAVVLSAVMRALGFNARTVTADTPKAERESILQQYTSNAGEPMALFNFGVLTAGFDAPATSAALIARPTRSLVLFSQMAGRAMRGTRAGGNALAEIVTVIDPALPGFGDPAEAFTNWEDVW